jgi:hypothetical protein
MNIDVRLFYVASTETGDAHLNHHFVFYATSQKSKDSCALQSGV